MKCSKIWWWCKIILNISEGVRIAISHEDFPSKWQQTLTWGQMHMKEKYRTIGIDKLVKTHLITDKIKIKKSVAIYFKISHTDLLLVCLRHISGCLVCLHES